VIYAFVYLKKYKKSFQIDDFKAFLMFFPPDSISFQSEYLSVKAYSAVNNFLNNSQRGFCANLEHIYAVYLQFLTFFFVFEKYNGQEAPFFFTSLGQDPPCSSTPCERDILFHIVIGVVLVLVIV
jgi:hypothetical protein